MGKSCFGAYDIRGIYPEQVNEKLAYNIGRSFPALIKGKRIALGRDVRLSGNSLQKALTKGLLEAGAHVIDLGMVGTELIYFAVPHLDLDGGIMITASHNPKEYNGMKFVGRNSEPLSGLLFKSLEQQVREECLPPRKEGGSFHKTDIIDAYVDTMLSYIDLCALKPYSIVANAGNGAAGTVLSVMEKKLPFKLVKIGFTPDGNFPYGVPNPLLSENQAVTAKAVKKYNADFGVAWDGDFDRCFIYDEQGRFVDSCYMIGFLAQAFLIKEVGAGIVYDSRAVLNIEDVITSGRGRPIVCKGGHVFFKQKMRETGAIYGGEMSAHHYFRDFHYCDSGMIPWLMLAELLSMSTKKLSQLLDERIARFAVSGERNLFVKDAVAVLDQVESIYKERASISKIDGLSVDLGKWRFNLRASNTEPVLRLNVESYCGHQICIKKTEEIISLIYSM